MVQVDSNSKPIHRRRLFSLFLGALAAGVTGATIICDQATALPAPSATPLRAPQSAPAVADAKDIEGAKVEKTRHFVRRHRRFHRRRSFYVRRRPYRYYRYY